MPTEKKRTRKLLRIAGASTLALFMGLGTLCGVLISPMNSAQASVGGGDVASSSNVGQGLITPKEDDPVIYTTESGLEIKVSTNFGTLLSGNLTGFPYFKTYDGSSYYTWVIIGQNIVSSGPRTYSDVIGTDDHGMSLFQTMLDNYDSPAGNAIANDYIRGLVSNEEIPQGSVLCLANDIVGTGGANTSSSQYTGYVYFHHSGYVGTLRTVMDGYYTSANFGISNIIDKILNMSITTYGYFARRDGAGVRYSWEAETVNGYIFPLASSNTESSFKWNTYLNNEQMKVSSNQWLRDGVNSSTTYSGYSLKRYMDNSGSEGNSACNNTFGYRPAFVLSLL